MGELDLDKIERAITLEPETEAHKATQPTEKEQKSIKNIQTRQKAYVRCYYLR